MPDLKFILIFDQNDVQAQNVGVEPALCCFMPMYLECPVDGCENMFAYASGSCVPYPWQDVSMSMLAGDLCILGSYVIHRGGAVPRDAPAGSTRIIAIAAIATRRIDYNTIVLIIPPPLSEAPAQQPLPPSPKPVHCTAPQCNRVVKADPPAKCFACDNRPLPAVHVGELCADCQRYAAEDAPTVEATPAEMAAEGAEQVNEGTQNIVKENLCGYAALVIRCPWARRYCTPPIAQGHRRQTFKPVS